MDWTGRNGIPLTRTTPLRCSPAITRPGSIRPKTDAVPEVDKPQNFAAPETLTAVPNFKLNLNDTKVRVRDSVSLKCEVNGQPEPQIVWRKDGKVGNLQSLINFATNLQYC